MSFKILNIWSQREDKKDTVKSLNVKLEDRLKKKSRKQKSIDEDKTEADDSIYDKINVVSFKRSFSRLETNYISGSKKTNND